MEKNLRSSFIYRSSVVHKIRTDSLWKGGMTLSILPRIWNKSREHNYITYMYICISSVQILEQFNFLFCTARTEGQRDTEIQLLKLNPSDYPLATKSLYKTIISQVKISIKEAIMTGSGGWSSVFIKVMRDKLIFSVTVYCYHSARNQTQLEFLLWLRDQGHGDLTWSSSIAHLVITEVISAPPEILSTICDRLLSLFNYYAYFFSKSIVRIHRGM